MIDDSDFMIAITELSTPIKLYSVSDLDQNIFNPFEYDLNDDLFTDIDPDLNYFAHTNVHYSQSSYYTDAKFNQIIDSSINDAFPIFPCQCKKYAQKYR